ncbi:MAG TPA: PQQ-dependent sugar dehydrogenase, partial [Thermomicrobiales bacterium]|nr:PQQ-dependent sugar dehydrogenase [Thermomicrobiales bacterium]
MSASRLSTWGRSAALAIVLSATGVLPTAAQSTPTTPAFDPATFAFGLTPVVTGLDQPAYVADPNDGSGRLFIVERPGRILIVRGGKLLPQPFLDLSSIVTSQGQEQGLLSVAFDPNFKTNGEFYVGYTANTSRTGGGVGDDTIARYKVSANDSNQADPASGEVLLAIDDPYPNHNGGLVMFGPDGYLYAGFGDGGSQGDPNGNGQNTHVLLGKVLRLDVHKRSGDLPYAIPPDNPFANGQAGRPEIWAYGLRNPWRFSFDRATGDLYIGDVGQNTMEEIDFQPAGAKGGQNYGWNIFEGTDCYAEANCATDGMTMPVATYTHDQGCSVTGGYVYRGAAIPALHGVYLFGDYCSGLIWGLGRDASGGWTLSAPVPTKLNISSFGQDASGELYV